MGAGRWEEALEGFTADKVVTREDVTGMTWLGTPRVVYNDEHSLFGPDDYDLCWNLATPSAGYVSVGVNLAYGMWAEDSPLGDFWRQTWNILGPVASTPTGNASAKYGSFDTAADSLEQLLALLTVQQDRLLTWGNQIDQDDSPAQGSAAAAFKAALTALAGQLGNLRHQALAQGDPVARIRAAGTALRQHSYGLATAYEAWRPKWQAVPFTVLQVLWQEVSAGYVVTLKDNNRRVANVSWPAIGDLGQDASWKYLESLAKNRWTEGLAELDTAAVTHVRSLGTSYQQAVQAIPASLVAPRYRTPYQEPSADDPTSDTTTDDTTTDTSTDDITADGPPTAETESEVTGPDVSTLSASGTGDGGSALLGDGSTDLGAGTDTGTGTGTGTDTQLTGPGTGTQEVLTPGGEVLTDTGGNPVTVPAGSVINPDGTVTKPGGGLLTDSKGNVVRLPSGSSLGSTLTSGVRRNSAALALAAQEAAQEAAYQRALKNARASTGALGEVPAPAATKGTGVTRLTGTGTGTGVGVGAAVGPSAALSRTATTSTEGLTATPGTAPKETPVSSRTTTSSNGPTAMPPGAGMGAGGAPGGRDRDRRTWLDEDEETWGTTQGKGTGVIG